IRHIALLTKDTAKLAEFYKASFGLKEVARSGEPTEHGQAIYLSDGHINLAVLPARNRREGIYHFGMEVEDVKRAAQTALAAGASGGTPELPRDGVLPKPSCSIRWARGSICRWAGKCSSGFQSTRPESGDRRPTPLLLSSRARQSCGDCMIAEMKRDSASAVTSEDFSRQFVANVFCVPRFLFLCKKTSQQLFSCAGW